MKRFFYKQWKDKRIAKIINIFGEDWFAFKDIIELGAAHGDIGYELMQYGANVTFVEVRKKNANSIREKFLAERLNPEIHEIDQNKPYNFNKKFDLVLNMGVLYHLYDWKNDIKCSLDHSNIMILETVVNPKEDAVETQAPVVKQTRYGGVGPTQAVITQQHIEEYLSELGCKFIRFDDSQLNTTWSWLQEGVVTRSVYDWRPTNYTQYLIDKPSSVQFRRMWLVMG
jgi:2-polyprenyl-3-methyl-5-hydroxy-6-metoxy-1,4-benzoquinol methylase